MEVSNEIFLISKTLHKISILSTFGSVETGMRPVGFSVVPCGKVSCRIHRIGQPICIKERPLNYQVIAHHLRWQCSLFYTQSMQV